VDHSQKLLPSKVTFGRGTARGERAGAVAMEEDLLFPFLFSFFERERERRKCYTAGAGPN
jgi:hypothetical protein